MIWAVILVVVVFGLMVAAGFVSDCEDADL